MIGKQSATPSQPSTIRPLVAKAPSNKAVWIFGACALIGGTALFASLEARRSTLTTAAIAPGPDDDAYIGAGSTTPTLGGAVPPIAIPADPAQQVSMAAPVMPVPLTRALPVGRSTPFLGNVPPYRSTPISSYVPPMPVPASPSEAPATPTGPEIIYDANRGRPQPNSTNATDGDGGKPGERVQATHFANPGMTVPKGTVIQAVLESALDSTRAGLARAIISRDVYAFDGSKVLIQRGSRLIGEYKADLASGQSRALIQWQRLMRPDGVIVNLDSPSADPLGRAGVKGKVHSHFMQRFGGAILQSALDVGQQVAVNELASGTTIYAMGTTTPGSGQNGATLGIEKVQPTLTVKQGASVSVFVARDLDFSSVGS